MLERVKTDILILGSGGAGLFAALHALQADPDLDITVASKGLLGKSGCTRMVQGGYNVSLIPGNSVERHFMDTIEGGKWLPNQELAWTLVETAVERVRELENEIGCFFDRNADGSLHGKAFAGQTFDRTVHKGDLTGIEIINRLMEQVWARPAIRRMEEHRAIALIPAKDRHSLAGVLMIDVRTGTFRFVQAKAVLLATGGGPTMYRYHTPSGDKSMDGLAIALRLGLPLRDMEMVQFHPTGVLAGRDTRMTGTIIEEGLRGSGGYLLNGTSERFMFAYDFQRRTGDARHRLARHVRGDARRPHHAGRRPLHQHGASWPRQGAQAVQGHGRALRRLRLRSGRRTGRGGADGALPHGRSCMRGRHRHRAARPVRGRRRCRRRARRQPPRRQRGGQLDRVRRHCRRRNARLDQDITPVTASRTRMPSTAAIAAARHPLTRKPGDINRLRDTLLDLMWEDVGIIRSAESLTRGLKRLDELGAELHATGIADTDLAFNLTWHDWLNLENLIEMSKVVAAAALRRENSRGAHYRADFTGEGDLATSTFTVVRKQRDRLALTDEPVRFTLVKPGETLLKEAAEGR